MIELRKNMRFVRLNGSTLKTVLFAKINLVLLQANEIMFMGNAGFVRNSMVCG